MSKMEVTEQFWSYGLLAYIAECGGFVGLFLGYSLMQLKDVMIFLGKTLKNLTICTQGSCRFENPFLKMGMDRLMNIDQR